MSLSLKIVVVLRSFSKPAGFVIPFQIDDFKKFCESSVNFFDFCDSDLYHDSANSSHRGARSHRAFSYAKFGFFPQRRACLGMEISELRLVS